MPILRNEAPLIVTAVLDAAAFAVLDELRQRHFPAHLNKVPTHISLFHHLPGDAEVRVLRDVENVTRGRSAPRMTMRGPTFLGHGVAIGYESSELEAARAALARDWSPWLTAQDRQRFRPHVTIQNKVAAAQARSLFEAMQGVALPNGRIEALAIWRYLGGPWEAVAERRFAGSSQ